MLNAGRYKVCTWKVLVSLGMQWDVLGKYIVITIDIDQYHNINISACMKLGQLGQHLVLQAHYCWFKVDIDQCLKV